MKLKKTIQDNEGTIVDVRTAGEFQGAHAAHSINIPLHELSKRIDEIKKMKAPVVLCCASGGRSAQAAYLLEANKIECIDAGPWVAVHSIQS